MRIGLKKLFTTIFILGACLLAFSAAEAVTLSAYADPASVEPGGQSTIYLQLRNDSGNTMVINSVDSNYSGFSFNYPYSIAPGEDGLCYTTVTIPDSVLGQAMSFTVNWSEYDGFGNYLASNSQSATVTVQKIATASLTATRTASAKQASPGETITITYTLTNTGNTAVTNVSITDRELQRSALVSGVTIEPGVPYTYELTYTMGYSTVTSAPVISYTANGETKTLNVSELTLGMINSKLTVSVEQGVSSADGVVFTIYLTNNGNQKISKIRIKDELGNSVNEDTFALAIGESTTLSYTVPTDAERNVVFYITGSPASGDSYEDKTSTYTVHKYIDPSLIGLDFGVEVMDTLDGNGSIKLRFKLNNTGVLTMYDVVLSEEQIGEIRRTGELAPGALSLEETIYVGEPRDMAFTITMQDESSNTYTYTASLSAAYIGVEEKPDSTGEVNVIDEIESLGSTISATVSRAVTTVLTVIAVLTVISGGALILLLVLENRQKREMARKKAARERAIRERAARAAAAEGETVYIPRQGGYAPMPHAGQAGRRGATSPAPARRPAAPAVPPRESRAPGDRSQPAAPAPAPGRSPLGSGNAYRSGGSAGAPRPAADPARPAGNGGTQPAARSTQPTARSAQPAARSAQPTGERGNVYRPGANRPAAPAPNGRSTAPGEATGRPRAPAPRAEGVSSLEKGATTRFTRPKKD